MSSTFQAAGQHRHWKLDAFLRQLLSGFSARGLPRQRALFKVNRFAAAAARLRPIEFIRKYFLFLAAFRTFTHKRFKGFEVGKPGTVLRGVGHRLFLSIKWL